MRPFCSSTAPSTSSGRTVAATRSPAWRWIAGISLLPPGYRPVSNSSRYRFPSVNGCSVAGSNDQGSIGTPSSRFDGWPSANPAHRQLAKTARTIRALNMTTLLSEPVLQPVVITVRPQPSVMNPIVRRCPAKPFVEGFAVIVLVKVAKLV